MHALDNQVRMFFTFSCTHSLLLSPQRLMREQAAAADTHKATEWLRTKLEKVEADRNQVSACRARADAPVC